MIRTVQCPSCSTAFPVDPRKVPDDGVYARCSACDAVFFVDGSVVAVETTAAVAATDVESAPHPQITTDAPPLATEETDGLGSIAPFVEPEAASSWEDAAPGEPLVEEAPVTAEANGLTDALDSPDTWVFETEPEVDPSTVQVTPLDTVEEQLRRVKEEPSPSVDGEMGLHVDLSMIPEVSEPTAEATTAFEEPGTPESPTFTFEEPAAPESPTFTFEEPAAPESPTFTFEEPGTPESPTFTYDEPAAPEPPTVEEEPAAPEPPAETEPAPPPAAPAKGFTFGKRDPHEKASRLARVLVSDIITYNPERHRRALEAGTLKADFDDEIRKSWGEYVDQVGRDMAESTGYFNDALNEILARGEQVF